jgi:DNA-binding HxlR family transcriptional regulator
MDTNEHICILSWVFYVLNILEKVGSYEILQSLSIEDRTLSDLLKIVSQETLVERLKDFEQLSYVNRVEMTGPTKIQYSITDKGRKALQEFIELQLISERPE